MAIRIIGMSLNSIGNYTVLAIYMQEKQVSLPKDLFITEVKSLWGSLQVLPLLLKQRDESLAKYGYR